MMRPLPRPTTLSRPFWDGCRDGTLLVQNCTECGKCFFTPSAFCPHCLSTEYTWIASAGRGHIVTTTAIWRPPTPAFDPPYIVAVVRLEEDYEMLTNIVDVDAAADLIGRRVQVRFQRETDEITLPLFELAATDRSLA